MNAYTAPHSEHEEQERISTLPQSVQWLIQDIAARYEEKIAELEGELEGEEERANDAENEANRAWNEASERQERIDALEEVVYAADQAMTQWKKTEDLDDCRAVFDDLCSAIANQ